MSIFFNWQYMGEQKSYYPLILKYDGDTQPPTVACPGIRNGGGGGENLKGFVLAFHFSRGGGKRYFRLKK